MLKNQERSKKTQEIAFDSKERSNNKQGIMLETKVAATRT
jgi:hypothetical protein